MAGVNLNQSIERTARAAAKHQLRELAEKVEEVAKQTAPVDTGRYRDSIKTDELPNDGGFRVSANTPYAVYLEFGTRHMHPYRTLGRALDAAKE